jgi:hypothetical protein
LVWREPDLARDHGQAGQQGLGFGATVGLDDANHDIGAGDTFLLGGTEHGVCLADARAHPEKNLEVAALGARLRGVQ